MLRFARDGDAVVVRSMDRGTILGFSIGYVSTLVGIFLLYLPNLVLL